MSTQKDLATQLLEGIIQQIQSTMIQDKSALTSKGFAEMVGHLALANQLLLDDDSDT